MSNKSNNSRLLLYVPCVHCCEDMGSFADRLPNPQGYSQKSSEYWGALANGAKRLPLNWSTVKVYQDGLPDTDPRIVLKIIEEVQSPNYELLRWLMSQGARVLGTESPALLKQEYQYLAAIFNAKDDAVKEQARSEYACEAPALLKARDQYIAGRIDATLNPEDIGLLFIGKAHRVAQELLPDILVWRMIPERR